MSTCITSRSMTLLCAALLLIACGETPKPPADDSGEAAPTITAEPASAVTTEAKPAIPTEVVAAQPEVAAMYEGKIVRRPPSTGGKEDGWYFVKNGKRRWISDAAWLEKNGYQVTDVIEIPAEELQLIPEDTEVITP